jgi:long-chain acyl-CoA synthetase
MLSSSMRESKLIELEHVILLKRQEEWKFKTYDQLREDGSNNSQEDLDSTMKSVTAGDICNLQFASGTTGSPKAAMLTHQ